MILCRVYYESVHESRVVPEVGCCRKVHQLHRYAVTVTHILDLLTLLELSSECDTPSQHMLLSAAENVS
jgi:hypothetical protein